MHSSWGQGWEVHPPSQIFNTRWLWPEHKTFLTHHRHERDHWDEVCCAWFTGTGVLVWENVFGNDTPWVERGKALLRAVKPLLATFHENFSHPDWQPFAAAATAVCGLRATHRWLPRPARSTVSASPSAHRTSPSFASSKRWPAPSARAARSSGRGRRHAHAALTVSTAGLALVSILLRG